MLKIVCTPWGIISEVWGSPLSVTVAMRSEAEGGVGCPPRLPESQAFRQSRYGRLTVVPSPLLVMVKVPEAVLE